MGFWQAQKPENTPQNMELAIRSDCCKIVFLSTFTEQ